MLGCLAGRYVPPFRGAVRGVGPVVSGAPVVDVVNTAPDNRRWRESAKTSENRQNPGRGA